METTQSTKQEELPIHEQDRGENFSKAELGDAIMFPITRKGFENLIETCCKHLNVPVNNAVRQVVAGYIHHVGNDKDITSIAEISKVIWKSIANSTSWIIDQEIKEAMRLRQAAIQAENKANLEARLKAEAEEKRKQKQQKRSKLSNGASLTTIPGGASESSEQTTTN